jgi:glycosyltransferase involved in cell wall biosynthesis
MRILHVARRYWPSIGGVESFLRHVATEQAKRHEVTVLAQRIDDGPHERLSDSVSPPPTFEAFNDGPVRVRPLRVPASRRAMMAPLITHVLPITRRYAYGQLRVPAGGLVARAIGPVIARHAAEADIVHMWTGDLLASAALRGARLARVPFIISPIAHRGQWGYDPASVRLFRKADRVLALLETETELYREHGVAPARIEVSGVCAPQVALIAEAEARRRLGVSGPLVLFLGARRSYKGFDLLVRAAPRIGQAVPGAKIAFVGPGEPLPDADHSATILDVGLVDEGEKALWLNASSTLCLPSEAETFGVAILEAWSVGTPAVTSDIPALKELIDATGGGAYAPRDADRLGSLLIDLLGDPERLEAMGTAGRDAWRTRFTPDHVARWHEDVYAAAIRETRSR